MSRIDEFFDVLDEWAVRTPGQIALASRGGFTNYEDLLGNVASSATALMRAGIGPGKLVVVSVGNPDVALILTLALMRIGCRVGYSRDLVLYEAATVAVDAVIVDPPATPSRHPTIPVAPEWFRGAAGRGLRLSANASQCSVITSSSGSTGRPKLIECGSSDIVRRVTLRNKHVIALPAARCYPLFGQRTIGTLADTFATLAKGGTVIGSADRRSATVLDTIQLFDPDYVTIGPGGLYELMKALDAKPRAMRKLRVLRSTGAYLSPDLRQAAKERVAEAVVSSYATTEVGWIAVDSSGEGDASNAVGQILEDVQVAAFDGDGRMLAPGNEGEIRAKVPEGTAGAYLGEDRHGAFRDGWFRTGDIGLVDELRNLILRGRADNVINIGGSKLNPEVLEDHIRTMRGVVEAGVTGIDLAEGYQRICAVVVSESRPSKEAIGAYVAKRGAGWPIAMVKHVEAIPRTDNGKIDRAALKRLCAE